MKPQDVHRSVTNLDDTFDTTVSASESHESRDEDDSKPPRDEDLRDEVIVIAAKRPDRNIDIMQRFIQTDHRSSSTVIVSDEPFHSNKTTRDPPPRELLLTSSSASFEPDLTHVTKHIDDDDNASFTFFGMRSFDDVSHTTELEDAFGSSPMPAPQREQRQGIDISLPALSHSNASMADISPIKLDLDCCRGESQQHQPDLLEPFDLQFSTEGQPEHTYQQKHQHQQHQWESPYPPPTPPRPYGYEQDRNHNSQAYSNPFYVLRSCGQAFGQCGFLLSHLQRSNPLTVNCSAASSFHHYQNQGNVDSEHYDSQDLLIATRRVTAAICAFGGSNNAAPPLQRDRDAIFRGVNKWSHNSQSRFHKRYHMSGSHISWEMEEHPPIIPVDDRHGIQTSSRDATEQYQLSPDGSNLHNGISSMTTPSPTPSVNSEPPKMKYRCKLCGLPKQNHSCRYHHSMQRSIGVSVYPAANAFAANEPGVLAPPLSDMNNFVDSSLTLPLPTFQPELSSKLEDASNKASPIPRTSRDGTATSKPLAAATEVSPTSSDDTLAIADRRSAAADDDRKRKHSELLDPPEKVAAPLQVSPFAETAPPLRWEQYRAVAGAPKEGAFEYPPVPLSFLERKKLSDTLFALTKEIRYLTEEVASILHEARERELWDLAVAEMLTQVVVALYCGEGDKRLDGLQHYLLAIGIAC